MSSRSGRPKDRFDRRKIKQEKDRNPYSGGKRTNKPSKKEVKLKFDADWGDDNE